MSLERLGEVLTGVTDRSGFVKRLAAASLGAVVAALGLAEVAHASHCCNLCFPASGSCSNCHCTWCWTCCDTVSRYRCCECFEPGGCCCNGCSGAKCSWVESLGGCPPPLLPAGA